MRSTIVQIVVLACAVLLAAPLGAHAEALATPGPRSTPATHFADFGESTSVLLPGLNAPLIRDAADVAAAEAATLAHLLPNRTLALGPLVPTPNGTDPSSRWLRPYGDADGDAREDFLDVTYDPILDQAQLSVSRGSDLATLWTDARPVSGGTFLAWGVDATGDGADDLTLTELVVTLPQGQGACVTFDACGGAHAALLLAWTVTLIDGRTGGELWTRSYDGRVVNVNGAADAAPFAHAEADIVRTTNHLVIALPGDGHVVVSLASTQETFLGGSSFVTGYQQPVASWNNSGVFEILDGAEGTVVSNASASGLYYEPLAFPTGDIVGSATKDIFVWTNPIDAPSPCGPLVGWCEPP
ncbi:MAG: hypothetical protein WDA16_01960 [Candidatus Thermoplasmatota archaeon]